MDELIIDFIAETREGLEALDSELVRFEQNPEDPDLLGGIFRLVHTIKGACGFLGLMRLQTVAHAAENLLGAFRDGELAVEPVAVSAILDTVDVIRAIIDALAVGGAEPVGDDSALIARLEAVLVGGAAALVPTAAPVRDIPLVEQLGGDATLDAAAEMAIGGLAPPADFDRLQGLLREVLIGAARGPGDAPALTARLIAAGLSFETVEGPVRASLSALEITAGPIDALLSRLRPATPVAAQEPAAQKAAAPVAIEGEVVAGPQTIRVSVDALEHLMTVVSELVLIRNQLIQTLRLEPESAFAAPLNRLNQVTSELQEGVMTTRMQPISGAWAKLPRLVRDLAHDLGKKIELTMVGQETELDRQVLELIKDPLTHMIRNAADHGLEGPEVRRAAGKAETGRITLAARHEGGAIVIEVGDDGAGLSAAKIRAKAASQGIATAAQLDAMSDAEARTLIFRPGFSTAEQVTAVSGRGVGMDVVRTNIEKIGGVIELASVEGAGSRFTIRIPLTLTIVSALIVECCGERFAMPQSSVIELVSANDASGRQIEYIDGAAVLRLRERLLPLVSLQSLLGLDAEAAVRGETCIVVARVGAFTFGVIVDRVFDTEEIVVKPVTSVLRHLKVYSGATILGDGAVILILDFKSISSECGADLVAAAEAEAEIIAASEPLTSLLVVRAADGALQAAPLADVSRIEEVSAGQIETVDGRDVIQYRGRLMPVATTRQDARDWPEAGMPMLVFTRDDRSVGLLVREIVDIVEVAVTTDLAPCGVGTTGSMIIAGAATEMIDLDHYWRQAFGEPMTVAAAPAPEPAAAPAPVQRAPSKRLLVIDQSPFTQLLLGPLLGQAGYDVTVVTEPEAALALHDAGEAFHLIMTDTGPGQDAGRRVAASLSRATAWHRTPLLGLGISGLAETGSLFENEMLDAVAETLGMRSAA